jgi:hypothetical protein
MALMLWLGLVGDMMIMTRLSSFQLLPASLQQQLADGAGM